MNSPHIKINVENIVVILLMTVIVSCTKTPELSSNDLRLDYEESLSYQKGSDTPFSGKTVNHPPFSGREINNYKDGKLHGLNKSYQENGKLGSVTRYNNGVTENLKKYHSNGKLWFEYKYEDDSKTLELQYHENGQLNRRTPFVNDRRNGIEETYRSNGTRFERTPYVDGKKEGLQEIYDFDGESVARSYIYKSGKRILPKERATRPPH